MAGFSIYPDQYDTSDQLPIAVDNVTPVKAEVVNRHRDAIMSIEAELGLQPSGTYTTVRARLDALEALIADLSSRVTNLEEIIESGVGGGGSGGSGGSGNVRVQDDGVTIVNVANTLNFTGPGVQVLDGGINAAQIVISGIVQEQESFTVDTDGQTAFTLSQTPADATTVEMFVNGLKQQYGIDYTVSDTAVTYSSSISLLTTDKVEFYYVVSGQAGGGGGGSASLAQTLLIGNATGGTDLVISTGDVISSGDGTVDIDAHLSVDGNTTLHGLLFNDQSTAPATPSSSEGLLWVDTNGDLIYKYGSNTAISLNDPETLQQTLTAGNTATTSIELTSATAHFVVADGAAFKGTDGATGGRARLVGGAGTDAGAAGGVEIVAGTTTSGTAGAVSISAGSTNAAAGGSITLTTGLGASSNGSIIFADTSGQIFLISSTSTTANILYPARITTANFGYATAASSGSGASFNITGQQGANSSAGGALNITAGAGGSGGDGGSVSVIGGAGTGTSADGGNAIVRGGAGGSGTSAGGDVVLDAGIGTETANHGEIVARLNDADVFRLTYTYNGDVDDTTQNLVFEPNKHIRIAQAQKTDADSANEFTIEAHAGRALGGDGGTLILNAGAAENGAGGFVTIFGGNAVGGNGGDIQLAAGQSDGYSFAGGAISIVAGSVTGGGTGAGGTISLTAGSSEGGLAGDINILAGASDDDNGGDVTITGGASTVAFGGNVSLVVGNGPSGDGYIILDGYIDARGNRINDIATPVYPSDAANKAYVDSVAGSGGGGETLAATLALGNTTSGNDIVVSSGDKLQLANSVQIVGRTATNTDDIIALVVDSLDNVVIGDSAAGSGNDTIIRSPTAVNLRIGTLDKLTINPSNIDFHSLRATNIATPVAASDAATKQYVDAQFITGGVDLAAALSADNSTDGYDIFISSGDAIIGENDIITIDGYLNVTNNVAARGFTLNAQNSNPIISQTNRGTLWLRLSDNALIFTDENNNDHALTGDDSIETLKLTLSSGNETDGYDIIFSANDALVGADGYIDVADHLDFLGQSRVVNLQNPVDAQDAATKAYVDDIALTNPIAGDEDGYVALASGGDLTYLRGTNTNDVLTWNGSTWVAAAAGGINFPNNPNDNNKVMFASSGNFAYATSVTSDGSYLGIGSGVLPTSGDLRTPHGFIWRVRLNGGTTRALLDFGSTTTDVLTFGGGFFGITSNASSAGHKLQISGSDVLTVTASTIASTASLLSLPANSIIRGASGALSLQIGSSDVAVFDEDTVTSLASAQPGYVLALNGDASALEYVSISEAGTSPLGIVLDVGNTTDGYDIIISSGTSIVAAGANIPFDGDISVTGDGYISGDFEIGGKLTVAGLIDPTGLVLNGQDSRPTTPDEGDIVLWYDSGDDKLKITDHLNNDREVGSGVGSGAGTLKETLALGNVTDGYDIILSVGDVLQSADGYVTIADNLIVEGHVDVNNNRIVNVDDPIVATDAATKNYVDTYTNETRIFGTVTTVDDTPTTITGASYDITTADKVVLIDIRIIARDQTTGESAGWKVVGVFERTENTVTQIGTTSIISEEREDSSWTVDFDVSGTTINIQATGDSENQVKWRVVGTAIEDG